LLIEVAKQKSQYLYGSHLHGCFLAATIVPGPGTTNPDHLNDIPGALNVKFAAEDLLHIEQSNSKQYGQGEALALLKRFAISTVSKG
jgi:hypothetical protein